MSVKITNNSQTIIGNTHAGVSLFLRLMTDKIASNADANTPKLEGRLRQGILKQVFGLTAVISWVKVYAAVQERGMRADGSYRIQHYSTPGTGPHFAENAVKKAVQEAPAVMSASRLI